MQVEERLINILRNPLPLRMSTVDENFSQAAEKCYIYMQELGADRIRDDCHLTGRFQGAAHNACNLNMKQRERIPVYFTTLEGCDSPIIMQAIGKIKNKKLNCISKNHEKYISHRWENWISLTPFNFCQHLL